MEQLPGALTYPLVGNYGVPSSSLDEYGLSRRGPVSELSLYPFFFPYRSHPLIIRGSRAALALFSILCIFPIPPQAWPILLPPRRFESDKIHVSGLIIATYSQEFSHWDASCSLGAPSTTQHPLESTLILAVVSRNPEYSARELVDFGFLPTFFSNTSRLNGLNRRVTHQLSPAQFLSRHFVFCFRGVAEGTQHSRPLWTGHPHAVHPPP